MREIWKEVQGFNGNYAVSNTGKVKSLNYANTGKEKLLTPKKHHTGYLTVALCDNVNAPKNKSVHQLVASAFIPNPQGKRCVNHIDGNKKNNNVSNLEWVTHKENIQHAIRTGLKDPHKNNHPKGEKVVNSRAVLQFSKSGEFIKKWGCASDAARYYNFKPCMIINNAAGRTKSAHGFVWKYAD